MGKNYKIK